MVALPDARLRQHRRHLVRLAAELGVGDDAGAGITGRFG